MNLTLQELAQAMGADLEGDGRMTALGVCPLDAPVAGCVAYLEKSAQAAALQNSGVAAVICSRALVLPGFNLLRSDNPKLALARALAALYPVRQPAPGVHPTAVVHPSADVAPDACVGPCAVVEQGARIGAHTVIGPNVFVGENARIGAGCVLHPHCAVLHDCELGDRVILHSGTVIGSDGFGYVFHQGEHVKVPQVGRVVVEHDVEIGANSAVDRATLGETRIGAGAKIDNQVQIGHNCRVGRGAIICGAVGIAGSSSIGDFAVLAGQVGVSDHVSVGARAILGGKAGVIADIPEGKFYSGMPAIPHREAMRQTAALQKLPGTLRELQALKDQVAALRSRIFPDDVQE